MTDKGLYEHIRRLVRQQRATHEALDVGKENSAQEYCRFEMMKKNTARPRENRMNTLLKNFKNVESYINIMDIIQNLQVSLDTPKDDIQMQSDDTLPQIIPKSLQLKIREELGPILCRRYEQDSLKREQLVRSLRESLIYSGSDLMQEKTGVNLERANERFQLIDILRKDIRRKEVYFIQQRFDRELNDIGKFPKKMEDTKLFHKICSYLHMILQQEHKEKWASRQQKLFRQDHNKNNLRRRMRIPTIIRNYSKELTRSSTSNFRSNKTSLHRESKPDCLRTTAANPNKNTRFQDDEYVIDEQQEDEKQTQRQSYKKLQQKQQLVKENFTFRRRGIKAGLMVKIDQFVENLNDEEKKNTQASKKYGKALQSLGQQLENQYGKFKSEQLAQGEDIQDMKKYLENTLSRNKKDLKKFHHK